MFGGPSFKGWWLGGFPWVVGQWVGCEMGSGGYTCLCWVSPVSLGLFHKTGGGVYADSWSPSPVARKRRPCCLYRLGGCGVPQGRWWCVAIRPHHFVPPPVGGGMPTEDGGGGLAASLWDSLPFANGAGPARMAVVLTPPRCGLPSFSRMAWVQRGRRWCLRRLCWPTAGVAGLLWGCAGSEDGGGYLAASCSALAMRLTLWGVVDDVAVPIVAHRRVAMSCWQPTPLGSS